MTAGGPATDATLAARDPEVTALLPEARRTIRRVARTFALASRLLPRGIREDTELLYLVLRTLDDLVDREGSRDPDAEARLAAVESWAAHPGAGGEGGDRIDGGAASGATAETRILEDLRRRHPALPRDAVTAFVAGMRQDLAGPRMGTEADVDEYCYRVAGTVGRLMASILGAEGEEADRAARALGGAMQRTNILRDVDEDLARGRVYLAEETLRAHGLDAASLATGDRTGVLRDGIARADAAYAAGMAGIRLLPHGQRSIRAAAVMYREILRQIERDGLGARRPWRSVVPRWRKAVIVARCVLAPAGGG
ncbi:MAG: phytoene/squalene synthase family protein [Chloroflexi bacterium]|nr:phytoene/squalene synthase family protein [Chloroflexota bacterium]